MNSKFAFLAVVSIVFAGCTSPSTVQNMNTNVPTAQNSNMVIENVNVNNAPATGSGRVINSLDGLTYTFTSYNGEPVVGSYTMAFGDGRLAARICNDISGKYTLEGVKLNATLISTKMACVDEKANALETAFTGLFNTELQATVTSPNLVLEGSNGSIFLFTERK